MIGGVLLGALAAVAAFLFLGLVASVVAGPGFDCGDVCSEPPLVVWVLIGLVAVAGGAGLAWSVIRR